MSSGSNPQPRLCIGLATARMAVALAIALAACTPQEGGRDPLGSPSPLSVGEVHGFPRHPSLERLCGQSIMGAPGSGEITFELYASSEPPEVLAAWYHGRIPRERESRDGGHWTWRIPDPEAPRHVLTVYPKGAKGMPSCEGATPRGAKTLANFSSLTK